ncbi:cytochrome P450 4C1-like precursor [Bombyx mori]|uniref:Cytochrome P450 n=1 Tax=Bombyx mori TaxID=7091 RepID=L0N785_BOMMO|nr:cytochrome P450 4C1-like precursor [Bombyx mori]BAM73795.1 cytochrome P450 [Bombyx mori]
MLVQLILCIFVALWLLSQRYKKKEMMKVWEQLKNDYTALPLIGHAYMFFGSQEERMKTFQRLGKESTERGGLLALWQGSRLYVMISEPVMAEYVLKTCLEKDDILKCSRFLVGNGSVFAPVSIWRPRRKILAPTFSPKNLTHFVDIFSKQSSYMVKYLGKAAKTGNFSIWKYINTYSMDSICETTLGVKVNAQGNSEQPFLRAFEIICRLDSSRFCQPWLHNDTVYKMMPQYQQHKDSKDFLCNFIDQVIKSKRNSLEEQKDSTEADQNAHRNGLKSFLELLIESSGGNKGYTDLELQEETLVLVLAGTDTSAVGVAFTSVMLSRHQDVQEKVYEELKEVFGDSDRPIVADDLPKLKYLEAVIKETMRLYPPVPLIVRKVDKDVTLPTGLTLVKNCGIVINIWAVHRNPLYWGDDADIFRPERFIDTPIKHPAAFMAFSHGPRACIGYQYATMSMKTATANLLRHFRLRPAEPTDPTYKHEKNKPLRVKFDVMMKDMDNFTVQLEPRYK